MNQVILMTGLILSIVVLATGTIVQTVEAMKPTVDSETGVQIQCKIMKGDFMCKFSTRDKISQLDWQQPSGQTGIAAFGNNCPRSTTFTEPGIQVGVYEFTLTECNVGQADRVSSFEVTVDNSLKITSVVVV